MDKRTETASNWYRTLCRYGETPEIRAYIAAHLAELRRGARAVARRGPCTVPGGRWAFSAADSYANARAIVAGIIDAVRRYRWERHTGLSA